MGRSGGEPPEVGDRPRPDIRSLYGAVAALLLAASLLLLLDSMGGDNQRLGGLVLSVVFQVAAVALMWIGRGRRAATAGVGLAAIGVVPLVIHLFVDTEDPGNTVSSVGDFTTTATFVLLALAALWGAAFFFGPAKRYAIFLGGALAAMWLVGVVQVVDKPLQSLMNSAESSFVSVGPGSDFDSTYDPYGDDFSDDYSDDYSFGDPSIDEDVMEAPDDFLAASDPVSTVEDTVTGVGVVSLVFGLAYLALGAWRDARGDHRMGTPAFAVAIVALHVATLALTSELEVAGSAMLMIALGATFIWLGSRGGRRFTAWTGAYAVAGGITSLVADNTGDSEVTAGVVLAVLGLALAGFLLWRDGGLGTPTAGSPPQPAPGPPAAFDPPTPPAASFDPPATATPPPTAPPWGEAPPQPPGPPAGGPPSGLG